MTLTEVHKFINYFIKKHSIDLEYFYDVSFNTDTIYFQGYKDSSIMDYITEKFNLKSEVKTNESGHTIMIFFNKRTGIRFRFCFTD